MSRLFLMISVVDRSRISEYVSIFRSHNVTRQLLTRGEGTANTEMEELFGLESSESEKAVSFSIVTWNVWKDIKKDLESRVSEMEPWAGLAFVNAPWTGIAFVIPISSVGGERELKYLTHGQNFRKGEESKLKDTIYELLIVITNVGYSELVMDAARDSGATGGTIIHARGTSKKETEEFLGISLASERDMVFIVTTKEDKNKIMQGIMEKAGLETKARSIVFSLPVTETSGLKLTKDRIIKKEKETAE